ncbi:MAG: transglycosylase domain-containing protein, partial [Propionibacteriaceae bacterium]|nr:transglycosylase domain-containing protein [Propionibacteriaceae bacterium]
MARPARGANAASPRPKAGVKTWIKRILFSGLVVFLLSALAGLVGVAWLYMTVTLPDPNKDFQTNTTVIYYRDGQTPMGDLSVQNRESIAYAEMPQNIKDAVVAIENKDFWTDKGISLWGMARGAYSILTGGNVQGGSTITQQYIKILYLTSDQNVTRKVKELVLAYKMGQQLPKEKILEGYLNTIYFGRGAYGIQAAAKAFYGVEAKDLTLSQAVALAAVLNDPGGFNPPNGNVKLLLERYQVTLNNMVDMGTITKAQRDEIYYELPDFPQQEKDSRYGGPKGFLMNMVERELAANGFTEAEIKGGGLRVTTTIDPALQDAAVKAAQSNISAAGKNARKGADPALLRAGLASVEVGTGELLAMYGGPDFVNDSRNWATTPRPTASVFKINALVAGLQNGMSLSTKLDGKNNLLPPGDKTPVKNAGNANHGQISLESATAKSSNTAFVDLVLKLPDGANKVIKAANDLGIPTGSGSDWDPNHRIALGSAEVSPLHQAGALATLAAGGRQVNPHIVKEVKDLSGKVVYSANSTGEQRIAKDVAADATYALTKVVSEGTGRSLQALRYPAAGKTGTRDIDNKTYAAWFAGTTMQVSTAVVFVAGEGGNEDLNPFRSSGANFYGSSYPASTWLDYMKVAMQGKERVDFPSPAYVNGGSKNNSDGSDPTETPEPTPEPTEEPTPTPEPEPEPIPIPIPYEPLR